LSGLSSNSPDTRDGGAPRRPAWPVPTPPAPDEGMARPLPVRRRPLHRLTPLFPAPDAPPLHGQRPQPLPPRLDQVAPRSSVPPASFPARLPARAAHTSCEAVEQVVYLNAG